MHAVAWHVALVNDVRSSTRIQGYLYLGVFWRPLFLRSRRQKLSPLRVYHFQRGQVALFRGRGLAGFW